MMRHLYTIFCRRVMTDRDTGNTSILDVVDNLQFPVESDSSNLEEPSGVPLEHALVTAWSRREQDLPVVTQIRIRLTAPDGSVLSHNILKVDLRENIAARLVGRSKVFTFKGGGIYEWIIEREAGEDEEGAWIEQTRIPFGVEADHDALAVDLD